MPGNAKACLGHLADQAMVPGSCIISNIYRSNAAWRKIGSTTGLDSPYSTLTEKKGAPMQNSTNNEVTVVDIKMPFWSMVVFMVKAAIAAIPAVIILSVVASMVMFLLNGFFGGPIRHF